MFSRVHFRVGEKQALGNKIERAGLAHGNLYGVQADFLAEASDGQRLEGDFRSANLGDVSPRTGTGSRKYSDAFGGAGWLRLEGGACDTLNSNYYYFATTAALGAPSRLQALDFLDVKHLEWAGSRCRAPAAPAAARRTGRAPGAPATPRPPASAGPAPARRRSSRSASRRARNAR